MGFLNAGNGRRWQIGHTDDKKIDNFPLPGSLFMLSLNSYNYVII